MQTTTTTASCKECQRVAGQAIPTAGTTMSTLNGNPQAGQPTHTHTHTEVNAHSKTMYK